MKRETEHRLPKAARYPLYLVGLIILVIGELTANAAHASVDAEAVIAAVGFAFLVLSVALR